MPDVRPNDGRPHAKRTQRVEIRRGDRLRGPHGRRSRSRVWGPDAGSPGAVSAPGRRLTRFGRSEGQRPQSIVADRLLRQPRDNGDPFDRTLHAFDMLLLLGGTGRQERIVGFRGCQRRIDDPPPGFDAGPSEVSLQSLGLQHGRRFRERDDQHLRPLRILEEHHRGDGVGPGQQVPEQVTVIGTCPVEQE